MFKVGDKVVWGFDKVNPSVPPGKVFIVEQVSSTAIRVRGPFTGGVDSMGGWMSIAWKKVDSGFAAWYREHK